VINLDNIKTVQIDRLKEAYYVATQLPILYMGTKFQADTVSVDKITRTLSAGTLPNNFCWFDIDNLPVKMTFIELQGLSTVILEQTQGAFTNLQMTKNEVIEATTLEEIKSIV